MLDKILNFLKPKEVVKCYIEFEAIMELTRVIPQNDNNYEFLLRDLARLIARNKQFELMLEPALDKDKAKRTAYMIEHAWFDEFSILSDGLLNDKKEITFTSLMKKLPSDIELQLGKHIFFPSPWSREKLAEALAFYGKDKKQGEWEQNITNHTVNFYEPIGIGFLERGNHTITSGILQNEGTIKPQAIYDMSAIYDYVLCDGKNYTRKDNGWILKSVTDARMAAIFEIGRLMVEHNKKKKQ